MGRKYQPSAFLALHRYHLEQEILQNSEIGAWFVDLCQGRTPAVALTQNALIEMAAAGLIRKTEFGWIPGPDGIQFAHDLGLLIGEGVSARSPRVRSVRRPIGSGFAVFVGIDQYEHLPALTHARRDAQALCSVLLADGKGAFGPTRTALLINDGASPAADRSNILVALSKMCQEADPSDFILFYFAGHGFEIEGDAYFAANDTNPAALAETSLQVIRILDVMRASPASQKALIFDAPRRQVLAAPERSPMPSDESRAPAIDDASRLTIGAFQAGPGWEIVCSCASDEVSWEPPGEDGRTWTSAFVDSIARGTVDRDITVHDAFELARKKLNVWRRETRIPKQTPCYYCEQATSAVLRPSRAKLVDQVEQYDVTVLSRERTMFAPVSGRWNPLSPEPSIHLVPFRTRSEDLRHGGGREQSEEVFPLRVYVPSLSSYPPPHGQIYLFFNSVGEADPTIPDELGWDLASRKGIPSVWIPLPQHFCRQREFVGSPEDCYRPVDSKARLWSQQRVLQDLMRDPPNLLHMYRQIIRDVDALYKRIEEGTDTYWSALFKRDVNVSLFGYSLGGSIALILLLLNPERYKSVILLESGASMDQIDASFLFRRHEGVQKMLWDTFYSQKQRFCDETLFSRREGDKQEALRLAVEKQDASLAGAGDDRPWCVFARGETESREIWRDIVIELYDSIQDLTSGLEGKEARVFRRVLLGDESIVYKRDLARLAHKILLVTGGQDEIFPTRMLLDIGPDSGLALLQIPGLGHWLNYSSRTNWEMWRRTVVDMMETFGAVRP